MRLDAARIRALLREGEFTSLFVQELGWSHCRLSPINVPVDGQDYTLTAVSEMGGLVALQCGSPSNDSVPDYHVRRKIDRIISKLHYEHIIIYCDRNQQVWQWVKKEQGKPSASREHHFYYDQSGLPLIQKLDGLVFALEELDEEGNVSIKAVSDRVKSALDVDKVTKRFYDRFKDELEAFQGFITGVTNTAHTDWYASLMLNRLMFIYFIQKKGFLDQDSDYLRNRLAMVRERRGQNRFFSFYRSFLRVLFHEGLNSRERTPELVELIGSVPYLNGGLFEIHEIEQESPDLDICDEAFERVFDFFDQYEWHLDTRPMRSDREINPDVLGYIFEKYINQKQMGAYYTKEDITEYISKNTIIPYLFDAARKKCAIAFEGDRQAQGSGLVWIALREDPDRYIYEAVRKGTALQLPPEIAAGIADVSQRGGWNRPASPDYALPTEIWREVVARRQRYEEVKAKLAAGEVHSIDDLITLNLDIRQFAQDVIENTESPDLLRAFWEVLRKVTVLDPTCGSGAFLFAALNILEPLYEGCLGRMREFLEDWDILSLSKGGKQAHPNYYKWFTETLQRVEEHPNTRYFIFKSIILNNLYGVDIMPEAVEICKLRLFLKLAAEVEPDRSRQNMGLEPLPDIDFNVRAGNTLIGFADYDEVKKAIASTFDFDDAMAAIEEKAQEVDRLWQSFRGQQEMLDGGEITAEDKQQLRDKLKPLEDQLNAYLARQYVIDAKHHKAKYEKWIESHQPFHWFVDFHSILRRGGFDAIVGNPPYVELSAIRSEYTPKSLVTESCGNLYALCIERSLRLLREGSWLGLIVQQPVVSTQRMEPARRILLEDCSSVVVSTYDDRPSKLFDGIQHSRNAVIFGRRRASESATTLCVSSYNKWYREERDVLFERLHYALADNHMARVYFPKLSSAVELAILCKLCAVNSCFEQWILRSETSHQLFYKITGVGHWFTITRRPPRFLRGDQESSSTREQHICFADKGCLNRAFALLNSTLFYWYYQVRTNCRDFNPSDYRTFPVPLTLGDEDLSALSDALQERLDSSSGFADVKHSLTGAIRVEQFRPREGKSVVDEIDRVLAKHYGFTDEELDFIINYDIKYRMGLGGNDGEDQ